MFGKTCNLEVPLYDWQKKGKKEKVYLMAIWPTFLNDHIPSFKLMADLLSSHWEHIGRLGPLETINYFNV